MEDENIALLRLEQVKMIKLSRNAYGGLKVKASDIMSNFSTFPPSAGGPMSNSIYPTQGVNYSAVLPNGRIRHVHVFSKNIEFAELTPETEDSFRFRVRVYDFDATKLKLNDRFTLEELKNNFKSVTPEATDVGGRFRRAVRRGGAGVPVGDHV